jgi:hypothetical protein
MNKKKSVLQVLCGLIIGAVGLGGCENAKETIGLAKQAPDEFAVVTRAPLNIPPKFDLRPPELGAKRPQKVTPTSKARTILLRKNSLREKTEKTNAAITSGIFSNGEIAFLQLAGALDADSSIRQIVNKESSVLAEVGNGILRKVIFWRKDEKSGVLVDAEKEAKRLRQVVAEGEPITKGETPVIVRKKKGLLEGIF